MKDGRLFDEAAKRTGAHKSRNHRGWTKPDLDAGFGDYIALLGEKAFAERYSTDVDLSLKLNGDGGSDGQIETAFGCFKWDVKTYRKPVHLLVEARTCKASNIYVLARYDERSDSAILLGWQWGKLLMKSAPRDYGGCGIISYGCRADRLRAMARLDAVVISPHAPPSSRPDAQQPSPPAAHTHPKA